MNLIGGHCLLAKILFIPTNGNCIAASGSWEFFATGGNAGQDNFARRHLGGGEGGEAVVGSGGAVEDCIFKKKKFWGGFGLVWFL